MKRIISFLLVLATLALFSSCALFTEEQIVTVYNASNAYTVDCIAIATSPDVLNADDVIYLLSENGYLEITSGGDLEIDVPTDSIGKTWYAYVSGAPDGYTATYGITAMIDATAEIGTLFDGLTYGIKIDFDAEANQFVITPLNEI